MRRHAVQRFAAAALMIALVGGSRGSDAAEVPDQLTDYVMTSWTSRDGLPAGIVRALAQDLDGYLWLGTEAGLLRFDGLRFVDAQEIVATPLPRTQVIFLRVTRNGDIWAVFEGQDALTRIRGRNVSRFDTHAGLPDAPITALMEDTDAQLWVGTADGLYRLTPSDRWSKASADLRLPEGAVLTAHADPDCGLFVAVNRRVYVRAPSRTTFEAVGTFSSVRLGPIPILAVATSGAASGPDGRKGTNESRCANLASRVFITAVNTGFHGLNIENHDDHGRRLGTGIMLLPDHAGSVWLGTSDNGLWRLDTRREDRRGPTVEKVEALPVEGVFSLLMDSAGTMWIGSTDTLVRLTRRRFESMTEIAAVNSLAARPSGDVWAGTADGLVRFTLTGGQWTRDERYLPNVGIQRLAADSLDTLWIATDAGVARVPPASAQPMFLAGTDRLRRVDSVSGDGTGGVWIHDASEGLVHWRAATTTRITLPSDLDRQGVLGSYTDRSGVLWLTFADGRIAAVDSQEHIRTFGREDGLDGNPYRNVYQDRTGALWFAGYRGLSLLSGTRFYAVHTSSLGNYSRGIIDDPSGDLWLLTRIGLLRFPSAEIQRAVANTSYQPMYRLYDSSDGLPPRLRNNRDRGATRAANGDLWFIGARGLIIVHPTDRYEQSRPSRALIAEVVADSDYKVGDSRLALRAGTKRLEVRYSALNLESPSKTVFKYRLDGFDRDWIEARQRRHAVYTNLAPGSYRFRVLASTDGGLWNGPPAELSFSVEPRFYQRRGFFAMSLLASGLVIVGTWRVRMKHHRKQFDVVLQERARLSREIHDTLLQSMAGIALHIGDLSKAYGGDSMGGLKARLTCLRAEIESALGEARRSIWNLRRESMPKGDLIPALESAAARATAGTGIAFKFHVYGAPRLCPEHVGAELLRVAQEALANAVRHAEAGGLSVDLLYDPQSVTLRVADNGTGFDPSVAAPGHVGLAVMRERTEHIGGEFRLQSRVGEGTVIEALVPLAAHESRI